MMILKKLRERIHGKQEEIVVHGGLRVRHLDLWGCFLVPIRIRWRVTLTPEMVLQSDSETVKWERKY
jgi:hypothetical protein